MKSTRSQGTRLSILVAEDDVALRRLVRLLLEHDGHHVIEVSDGEEAWELLQTQPIPLVITDWSMPGMDGLRLIEYIRSISGHYTYIIFLTARGDTVDVVEGLRGGADDYLVKPFQPGELQARVAIGERIVKLEQELRAARDQLAELALRDEITGLLNRRAIAEQAEAELARTLRGKQDCTVALLDIDHFKLVNDTYGHAFGDQALCFVATTLRETIRPYDHVGRWGGEEFLLVLPGVERDTSGAACERIRAAIQAGSIPLAEGHFRLTVSLGVATAPSGSAIPLSRLVKRADDALYRAKAAGRNRVAIFEPPRGGDGV